MAASHCTRCAGIGIVPCFRHIDGGTCYACDGSGVADGAPRPAPRGATAGKLVVLPKFGAIFVSKAPKGHLVATNEHGDGVPFAVESGRCVEVAWFPRYSGRTADLLSALTGALRVSA